MFCNQSLAVAKFENRTIFFEGSNSMERIPYQG